MHFVPFSGECILGFYALYKFITNQPLHLKPHEIDITFPNCCTYWIDIIVYHSYIEFTLKFKIKNIRKELHIN